MSNIEIFIRYLVKGHYDFKRWRMWVAPILEPRGWCVIDPKTISLDRLAMPDLAEHSFKEATVLLEYCGQPCFNSAFDPDQNRSIIDDLLAVLSLYTGVVCQYLWREWCTEGSSPQGTLAYRVHNYDQNPIFAGDQSEIQKFFERVLTTVPSIDKTRLRLAASWFFSALREYAIGRPLVEAALNWVCLESQANYRYPAIKGKDAKFRRVERLLSDQGFAPIPQLHTLYRLRNDAFHDGQLSNLEEDEAQRARKMGRALVRAQILNVLGMKHSDFQQELVNLYTS